MKEKVIMKDIAKDLNISIVSVSKALSGKDGISDELRVKIINKANALGYRTSLTQKNNLLNNPIIGIIAPEYFFKGNQYYCDCFAEIVQLLEENQYSAILKIISHDEINNKDIPRMIENKLVDGIIFLAEIPSGYIENISKIAIPFLLFDFYCTDINTTSIVANNFLGTYEITNFLINNGHSKIGFVGTINATKSISDRFLGYQKSLLEHSIGFNSDLIIKDRDDINTISNKLFKLPDNMPTAFVCNNDSSAFTFITFLEKNGYSVPKDVSIISFDNTKYSRITSPSITTYDTNIKNMSQAAVNKIIGFIKGENDIKEQIVVTGDIILRNSHRSLLLK
ncbi:MAG: LacI family DNA-binding transcriptional regulator [Lachnospirales bacterium]